MAVPGIRPSRIAIHACLIPEVRASEMIHTVRTSQLLNVSDENYAEQGFTKPEDWAVTMPRISGSAATPKATWIATTSMDVWLSFLIPMD